MNTCFIITHMSSSIYIPNYVLKALEILQNANYEAWIVGGYVRDSIINKIDKSIAGNHDIDIATNAKWQDTKQLFEQNNWKVIETGIKHGTLTVIYNSKKIEITTYRTESTYSDNRHPDSVEFVSSIKQDLARRDFTINAIAYSPTKGIFDPYYGTHDIKNKIIQTVGYPKDRFNEDALRILRGARFVSQTGFSMSEETYMATLQYSNKLKQISQERKRDELTKLLMGEHSYKALMAFKRIIAVCIPEISPTIGFDQRTKYHCYDVYEHSAVALKNIPLNKYSKEQTEMLVWAALLHDIGKPEVFTIDKNGQGHFFGHPSESSKITEQVLKNLNFSKRFNKIVSLLVRWHDIPTRATKRSIRHMLKRLNEANSIKLITLFSMLNDLKIADCLAHSPEHRSYLETAKEISEIIKDVEKEKLPYSIYELNINGNDLIELGVKPGPEISNLLNTILDAVINKEVENKKDELIKYAKTLL